MNGIKKLRTSIGLTQEQMANYLGVAMSVWSMAESGHRDLPTAALLKLSQMEILLSETAANDDVEKLNNETLSKAIVMLKRQLADLELTNSKRNRKLQAMEEAEAKAAMQLKLVKVISTHADSLSEKDRLWFELLEMKALETLNPDFKFQKLQLQIEAETLDFRIEKMKVLTV